MTCQIPRSLGRCQGERLAIRDLLREHYAEMKAINY